MRVDLAEEPERPRLVAALLPVAGKGEGLLGRLAALSSGWPASRLCLAEKRQVRARGGPCGR